MGLDLAVEQRTGGSVGLQGGAHEHQGIILRQQQWVAALYGVTDTEDIELAHVCSSFFVGIETAVAGDLMLEGCEDDLLHAQEVIALEEHGLVGSVEVYVIGRLVVETQVLGAAKELHGECHPDA